MTDGDLQRARDLVSQIGDDFKNYVSGSGHAAHERVRVAQSGAREIAFRIKSRFVVRGHYRNQAHGPNHSLRTMKWIAPFFKGPEEGARLVHTYKPTLPEDKA